MIESSHIKKMVDHILRRQRGVADREAMDPSREWLLGVGTTAFLVVLGGLASYGLYLNTISLEVGAEHVPTITIPYNAAVVDTAVEKFRARANDYIQIRGTSGEEWTAPVVVPDNASESIPEATDNEGDSITPIEAGVEIDAPELGV